MTIWISRSGTTTFCDYPRRLGLTAALRLLKIWKMMEFKEA
jgi:hypothetical protein